MQSTQILRPMPNLCFIIWSKKQKTFASGRTEFMCFKQDGDIPSLNGKPLKIVNRFTLHWDSNKHLVGSQGNKP